MSPTMRLAAAVIAAPLLLAAPHGAAAPPGTYEYRIEHPAHGEIGTYTNVVQRAGDAVVVETHIEVAVRVLFFTAHRVEAERREEYRNGRIVGFSSVTREGGRTDKVYGHADGDRFVLDGPLGQREAPGTVFPANPWTHHILDADTLFDPRKGRILHPRLEGGEPETITLNGRQLPARHYRVTISGEVAHDLWFDEHGIPVRFTTIEKGARLVLTLAR